jgi:hypothetical protein
MRHQAVIWLAVAILEFVLMPTPARTADNVSVTADVCAVAAGQEASGNTLNCYIGLTPEQLRGLTKLAAGVGPSPAENIGEVIAHVCAVAAEGDAKNNRLNCNVGPAVLVNQIKDISGKFRITEQAALTLLGIVGEDPSIPDEQLASALTKAAQDYKRLQVQTEALMSMVLGGNDKASKALLMIIAEHRNIPDDKLAATIIEIINNYKTLQRVVSEINSGDPTIQNLLEQVKVALSNGDFERSDELLTRVDKLMEAAVDEVRKEREEVRKGREEIRKRAEERERQAR